MNTFVALSQTYSGRDKLMRTAGYLSVFLTGAVNPQGKIARDLAVFAKQMSAARIMMRFFDDLPMLTVTKSSLLSKDKDVITKILTVLGNLSSQCYFPIEKIAWAADNNILPFKSSNWWTAGIASWAIFIVANILKTLRAVCILRLKRNKLIKQRKLESPEHSSDSEIELRRAIVDMKQQEFAEYVNIVKNLADLMMAVNWLPAGFLWAGKFSAPQGAFFGCVSSIIGMFQIIVQIGRQKQQ